VLTYGQSIVIKIINGLFLRLLGTEWDVSFPQNTISENIWKNDLPAGFRMKSNGVRQ
jgi:hypothetical protein